MGKTNPGGVQGLGQLSFFQPPNKKQAPVSCPGRWVNNQTAVMPFGSWLLQSSQALQADPSRFFATVSAAPSALTEGKRPKGGSLGDTSDTGSNHVHTSSPCMFATYLNSGIPILCSFGERPTTRTHRFLPLRGR